MTSFINATGKLLFLLKLYKIEKRFFSCLNITELLKEYLITFYNINELFYLNLKKETTQERNRQK